jgi:oxygen-independent coproporphyrinogen-3 oxidase
MRIKLDEENKRKIVYDIGNIFYDKKDLVFVKDEPDIYISEGDIFYKNKAYKYEDNFSLKKNLYKLLVEITGYRSPWGFLTGTKPSKLLQKYNPQALQEKYLISDEKMEILQDVKNIQDKFDFDKDNFNLYINIPFCPSRCSYCSYPTIVGNSFDKSSYIDCLLKEIDGIHMKKDLNTVYIGGGTPSFLEKEDLIRLLEKINEKFTYKEFTFEAGREDTLDEEKLKILRDFSVDRISINPQTFSQKVIENINRFQDLDRLIDLVFMSKDLGFLVNMDFILGLEGETRESFRKNFEILKKLGPENITFHALAQKVGSKYFENDILGSKEEALEMSVDIHKFTKENGYKPYYLYRQKNIISNLENIGYCKEGLLSKYNVLINEELENIIGLGMNSNSKLTNGNKYRNGRNLRDYMENLEKEIQDKNNLIKEYEKN